MKTMLVGLALSLPIFYASAQVLQREFPQNATPLADSALKEKIAGKTLAMFMADGVKWTYQFKDSGFFNMTNSAGNNSAGPWRAENGKLCTQPRNGTPFCGETRLSDDTVYMRRENGEVVKLEAP